MTNVNRGQTAKKPGSAPYPTLVIKTGPYFTLLYDAEMRQRIPRCIAYVTSQ